MERVNAVRQGEIPGVKKFATASGTRSKGGFFGRRAGAVFQPGGVISWGGRRGAPAAVAVLLAALLGLVLGAGGCRRRTPQTSGAVDRIVTLTPSATELVAALGAADKLVGVDDYSTYPPEVAKLPRVGSFLQPHLEAIMRLRPQVVIADDIHADIVGTLHDVGIDVVTAKMHALPDLKEAFARVGARLGRDAEAKVQAQAIEDAIAAARARQRGAGVRVLMVIDREAGGLGGMIGAAGGSWLGELVAITGAVNVLAASPVRYPKLSPEEVLRSRADVILDVSYAADPGDALTVWRSMATVPAVARGRVRVLKEAYLLSPSPRVAEALATIEAALAAQ